MTAAELEYVEQFLREHSARCGCIKWTGNLDDKGNKVYVVVGDCPEVLG